MIPVASTIVMAGALLPPDNFPRTNLLEDYEYGGDALNNSTNGLRTKVWHGRWDAGSETVFLNPVGEPEIPILVTGPGVTEISISFDQSMRPAIAYMVEGELFFWWFDSVANAMTTTSYVNCYSPMLSLDDHRPQLLGSSDILLFYLKGRRVYFRAQRERYLTEHAFGSQDLPLGESRITNVGLSDKLRMQVEVKTV